MTEKEILEQGVITRGTGGEQMVAVKVLINGFKDNGKLYKAGDTAHMELSMVHASLNAKLNPGQLRQVELVAKAQEPKGRGK